jgi:hypothetical protein
VRVLPLCCLAPETRHHLASSLSGSCPTAG